jgi:hypothetical protein
MNCQMSCETPSIDIPSSFGYHGRNDNLLLPLIYAFRGRVMNRQIILGMGVGQCGTGILAEILNQQVGANVTHQEPPFLSWIPDRRTGGMDERLKRILANRREPIVGDVASFYLPYVEDIFRLEPNVRIICLKRPREEVVEEFCRSLDSMFPFPVNHWMREPAPGWYHDPILTRIYPQYDTQDREEGIRRYWDEYYTRVDDLVGRYPDNMRLWDTEILTTPKGVSEVLSFGGIPAEQQVILTGRRDASNIPSEQSVARRRRLDPMDPRRCVILVPFTGFIHQDCEDALEELERRGYRVWRVGGYAAIDQGRNQMATDALLEGFEETLWIDSDVAFHPDSVDQLRSHGQPIVAGIYPQKGKRALACHVIPGSASMVFGKRGGLMELLYAGTGFLLIRREVYLTMQRKLNLPVCNERFGHPMIPFFQPMIRPIEEGHWYLAEDYAFCQRARQCGYRLYADSSVRLWHIGSYQYGWEDAGLERQRFDSFTLNFRDGPGATQATETKRSPALASFLAQYPWPPNRPEIPAIPYRDAPAPNPLVVDCLSQATKLIVEVGAGMGHSTRLLARLSPQAIIIAIDDWEGIASDRTGSELSPFESRLQEIFFSECWGYRNQIVPVKSTAEAGLQCVADAELQPDMLYISARQHRNLANLISSMLEWFPKSIIAGDGLANDEIRRIADSISKSHGIKCEISGPGWKIMPSSNPKADRNAHDAVQ